MDTIKCEFNGLKYEYEPSSYEDIGKDMTWWATNPVDALTRYHHAKRELEALKDALDAAGFRVEPIEIEQSEHSDAGVERVKGKTRGGAKR